MVVARMDSPLGEGVTAVKIAGFAIGVFVPEALLTSASWLVK